MTVRWPLPEALSRITVGRPLVVSDADEVLLAFLEGLEGFLEGQGYRLALERFAIHGQVRSLATGETVADAEVSLLLKRFYLEAPALSAVPGAVAALARLSEVADVLILSNVPAEAGSRRADNLKALGFTAPLVQNDGLKGEALAQLAARAQAPVVFIDDLPPHLASVAERAPQVRRLQFIADPRLARMAPQAAAAQARIDSWPEAVRWIETALTAA